MDNLVDKIHFRSINLEDAEALKNINDAITNRASDIDFIQIIKDHKLKNEEDTSFIAEIDGTVVGYMISYIIYGGFGLNKGAWIATLGVHPKYMGQGIGKMLAIKLFQTYRAKGVKHIYTSVMWDSIDLLSFFKTLGFDRSAFINLKKVLED